VLCRVIPRCVESCFLCPIVTCPLGVGAIYSHDEKLQCASAESTTSVMCEVVSCSVVTCRVVLWRVMSCLSCRVVSGLVLSSLVCRAASRRVVFCRVVSYRVVSCRVSCRSRRIVLCVVCRVERFAVEVNIYPSGDNIEQTWLPKLSEEDKVVPTWSPKRPNRCQNGVQNVAKIINTCKKRGNGRSNCINKSMSEKIRQKM
jgi:hypothetical protein